MKNKLIYFALAICILPNAFLFLQASTAYVGQLVQQINTAQINGTTTDTNAGNATAGTQRVVLATNQPAVSVTGSTVTIAAANSQSLGVYSRANNIPQVARIGATASSGQLIAANANRVALECDTDCNNTDRLFVRWGTVAATNADKRIDVCGSWNPPAVSTVAIQVISNAGTQNINCIEYSAIPQ